MRATVRYTQVMTKRLNYVKMILTTSNELLIYYIGVFTKHEKTNLYGLHREEGSQPLDVDESTASFFKSIFKVFFNNFLKGCILGAILGGERSNSEIFLMKFSVPILQIFLGCYLYLLSFQSTVYY